MLLSEQLKERLRVEFMPIKSIKVFSNAFGVNDKIGFIKTLDKGIRGTCSMILDFFEARVNTDERKDNYMIVYTSQQEIASEFGLSREWVSHCINRMAEKENCIFQKVRQGLNKANYYIMNKKRKLVDLLKQIYVAQQEELKAKNVEKQSSGKKQWYGNKKTQVDNFNNFEQRTYNFDELERKLLGWDNVEIELEQE